MNLTRLHTFATVIRLGTFSAAADALSFTPSAVSQQMTKLESELGVALLRRGPSGPGKRVELTDAGRALYAHALTIASAVADARDELAGLSAEPGERLRLRSFPAATIGLVPEALSRVRVRLPGLRHEVVDAPDWSGAPDRQVDLALAARVGRASLPEHDAPAVQIAAAPLMVALPAGHELAASRAISLRALDDVAVVGAPELPELSALVAAGALVGSRPRLTGWQVDHPLTLIALAVAGEGVAIVPPAVAPVVPAGAVLRALLDGPLWELVALWAPQRSPVVGAVVIEELRAVVASRPELRAVRPLPVPLAA